VSWETLDYWNPAIQPFQVPALEFFSRMTALIASLVLSNPAVKPAGHHPFLNAGINFQRRARTQLNRRETADSRKVTR
jgi:hypothetical protein